MLREHLEDFQFWHYWHLGTDNFLLWGIILCIVGYSAVSLAYPQDPSSTPQIAVAKTPLDIAKCLLGSKIVPN